MYFLSYLSPLLCTSPTHTAHIFLTSSMPLWCLPMCAMPSPASMPIMPPPSAPICSLYTFLILIQFFRYPGTVMPLALASCLRHVARSQSPHVTNVQLFPHRQVCSCSQVSSRASTCSRLGWAVTICWVMPVSWVQKGVSWGWKRGLMQWWNWATVWKVRRSTTMMGNQMIQEQGCSLVLSQQVASKSRTSRYCSYFVVLIPGNQSKVWTWLRVGRHSPAIRICLVSQVRIRAVFSPLLLFQACWQSILNCQAAYLRSNACCFTVLLYTFCMSMQLLISSGCCSFFTLSSASRSLAMLSLPQTTNVLVPSAHPCTPASHCPSSPNTASNSCAFLISALLTPVACSHCWLILGLHLGLTREWNCPRVLTYWLLTWRSMAEIEMASAQGLGCQLGVMFRVSCRQIRWRMLASYCQGQGQSCIKSIGVEIVQSLINACLMLSGSFNPNPQTITHTPAATLFPYNIFKSSMELLPLFTPSESPSSSSSLSSPSPALHPKIQQLLCSHNSVAVICAVVASEKARKFVRTMLLPSGEGESPSAADGPVIYSKMQMGYNLVSESYSWVYCEAAAQAGARIVGSLACGLVVEEGVDEKCEGVVSESVKNFHTLTGRHPNVYVLTDKQPPQEQRQGWQYIRLPKEVNTDKGDASLVQSLIQNSRKIVSESFVLTNTKGMAISSAVLPYYFRCCLDEQSQASSMQQLWSRAYLAFESEMRSRCLQEYKQKMAKMYEDSRKFIPIKILANSHDIASQNILKSISKFKFSDGGFVRNVEMAIENELSAILAEVAEINYRCGKSYAEAEIAGIESRVNSREIRAIQSLKYEIGHFLEFFHKKTESLSCKKLQFYCESFVVQKCFDFSSIILENQKRSLTSQLQQAKSKLSKTQSQIKELKKQQSKDSNQASMNTESLQQKIKYFKNRQQLLQSTISQLKLELQQKQQQSNLKFQQLQNQYLKSITQIRQSKVSLNEQLQTLTHKLTILQSQIQKQKQLHKQTHQHYQQMIKQFRSKQSQLKEEMSEIAMRASQELQLCRRDTERSLTQSSISNSYKQREGQRVVEELNEINRRYAELEKAYNHLQYEMQLKKSQFQAERADLQLTLKLVEQKALEYQSRLPRFQHMQEQIEVYEKSMGEQSLLRKQSEKQVALLRQHNSFISDQLRQLELKYQAEKLNCEEYKTRMQELEDRLSELNTVRVNEWVQTEVDSRLVDQLMQIQDQFHKLEKMYNLMKIKASRQAPWQQRVNS